jgi:thioredoxin reductase (NADPH)
MNIVVIGAGPAGMSCANALLSFGLPPVVIERTDQVGGIQRGNFHPNLWMLGMPGETGTEITERLAQHYFELPIATHLRAEIAAVSRDATGFRVSLTTPEGALSLPAGAIVLATGSQPRATPSLRQLAAESSRVIIGPLSETIRDGIHNSKVLILGGGDNALDHALFLAERGNRVTVCARRGFTARRQFQLACAPVSAITLRSGCLPDHLTVCRTSGIEAVWRERTEQYDWLLVMFGYEPNTSVLATFAPDIRPALTDDGHVPVDRGQRTAVPGLYAAGDVTECIQPSVPTAIAQGLAAAKAIELDQATQST